MNSLVISGISMQREKSEYSLDLWWVDDWWEWWACSWPTHSQKCQNVPKLLIQKLCWSWASCDITLLRVWQILIWKTLLSLDRKSLSLYIPLISSPIYLSLPPSSVSGVVHLKIECRRRPCFCKEISVILMLVRQAQWIKYLQRHLWSSHHVL